jgi:hypothetical protein
MLDLKKGFIDGSAFSDAVGVSISMALDHALTVPRLIERKTFLGLTEMQPIGYKRRSHINVRRS